MNNLQKWPFLIFASAVRRWCLLCGLLWLLLESIACQIIPANTDARNSTSHSLSEQHAGLAVNSGHMETDYFQHFWVTVGWVARPGSSPKTLQVESQAGDQLSETGQSAVAEKLVVAIEGDGRPWRHRYKVAADPTPRAPLLLDWLMITDHPALYLGRPCYFGQHQLEAPEPPIRITGMALNHHCDAYWYTFGRYSPSVVDSMKEAIQGLAADQCLILLGHSGGGTLAMLIASQIPQVVAVITLSGNLNVAGWQQYHDFTPLMGSLDPSALAPLSSRIRQIHISADGDNNVLSPWIEREALRQQAEYQHWNVSGHQQWHMTWDRLELVLTEVKKKATCQQPDAGHEPDRQ